MYKILVVDDTEDVLLTMKGILADAKFEVVTATNPVQALDYFIQSQFDFTLIDIRLFGGGDEDNSGLILGMTFKKLRPAIGIILFSAHKLTSQIDKVVRYHGILAIQKSPEMDREILQIIKGALLTVDRRTVLDQENIPEIVGTNLITNKGGDSENIYTYIQEDKEPNIAFSLSLHNNIPILIRSRGSYVYAGLETLPLHLDINKQVRRANAALVLEDWRISVEDIGVELWNEIFRNQPEVMSAYAQARGKTQNISLYIETPRGSVGIPFEFVRTTNPSEYMILQYPVTRVITSISPNRESISPEFLALKKELNILIIGSNTLPNIPGVDREVQKVFDKLNQHKFINVKTKLISSEEASYDFICEELTNSKYDIIHYAGHGVYDNHSPEKSCLFFWAEKGKMGRVVKMETPVLTDLLRTSETRFVYLSCCYGSKTGINLDTKDDFLGVADAVIQSGVPSVLGFRAPVLDNGAISFADCFYTHLLKHGRLDVATWEARRKLARINRDDPTWLSPVLISQH